MWMLVMKFNALALLTVCCSSNEHPSCKEGMFACKDYTCVYDYEVCDGHKDCSENEDEMNCTHSECEPEEFMCPESKRCIRRAWMCDGDEDCGDGSDEKGCYTTHLPILPVSENCDSFYCYATQQCLPWSRVCDGRLDCADLPDEGRLCSSACEGDNGRCSRVCQKTPLGSKCMCDEGYRLLNDNKTCEDIDECESPGTCSHFCINTSGSFKCTCAGGYYLQNDQRSCKAGEGPTVLLYLLDNQIRGLDLTFFSMKIHVNGTSDMRGMDYDIEEEVYYWTEWLDGSVNRFSTKNKTQEVIFRSHSAKPTVIKYDWIAKNLYFLNEDSSINVCTRDGRICKTIMTFQDRILYSLAIAPAHGLMFYTSLPRLYQQQNSGLISRAEMDGSHRIAIISDNLRSPAAVTVDNVLKRIYWVDLRLFTLECADFHGFQRKLIVRLNTYHPMSLAVFEDYVYFSDWGLDQIIKCHKYIDGHCTRIKSGNVKANSLMVIHHVMQPKATNYCQNNTCEHMCVLKRSDHVCMCEEPERDGACITSHGVTTLPTTEPTLQTLNPRPSQFSTDFEDLELLSYSDKNNIYIKLLKGEEGEPVTLVFKEEITGLSFQPKNILYIADKNPRIFSLNTTSFRLQVLVWSNLSSPKDVKFDWMSNNLYWVDTDKGTTEVVSVDTQRRVVLIDDLLKPVSVAISPYSGKMFVSEVGFNPRVSMYGMDGKDRRILHSVQGLPMSLALHPSETLLYWSDPRQEMISYVNYSSENPSRILMRNVGGVMSVAASEDRIFYTSGEPSINVHRNRSFGRVYEIQLIDQGKLEGWKSIAYSHGIKPSGKSECLIENGGCGYLCLTSPNGRTCACSKAMTLDKDNKTCLGKKCEKTDFQCSDQQCIPAGLRCDGSVDCSDGMDEKDCEN